MQHYHVFFLRFRGGWYREQSSGNCEKIPFNSPSGPREKTFHHGIPNHDSAFNLLCLIWSAQRDFKRRLFGLTEREFGKPYGNRRSCTMVVARFADAHCHRLNVGFCIPTFQIAGGSGKLTTKLGSGAKTQ